MSAIETAAVSCCVHSSSRPLWPRAIVLKVRVQNLDTYVCTLLDPSLFLAPQATLPHSSYMYITYPTPSFLQLDNYPSRFPPHFGH